MSVARTVLKMLLHLLVTSMGSKNGKPVLREEDIKQLASTSGLDKNQVCIFSNNITCW